MLGLLGYIDPVSGMLILQGIIAGIVGVVGFFRKSIWAFSRRFLGRKTDE